MDGGRRAADHLLVRLALEADHSGGRLMFLQAV